MKKYLYSLFCVFVHALTVILLLFFSVHVMKYDLFSDIKKITLLTLLICSFEWILLGFLFALKMKYRIKDIIILSFINMLLLFMINQPDIKLLEIRMSLIKVFSFSGFHWSIIRGDSWGDFGMLVYLIYYAMLFVVGVFVNRLLCRAKQMN